MIFVHFNKFIAHSSSLSEPLNLCYLYQEYINNVLNSRKGGKGLISRPNIKQIENILRVGYFLCCKVLVNSGYLFS